MTFILYVSFYLSPVLDVGLFAHVLILLLQIVACVVCCFSAAGVTVSCLGAHIPQEHWLLVWWCIQETAQGQALVWAIPLGASHALLLLLLLLLIPGIPVFLCSFSGLDLGKRASSPPGMPGWQRLEFSFWLPSVSCVTFPGWILPHL